MAVQSIAANSSAAVLFERLQTSKTEIAAFCERWHIEELSLFGSVVRTDFDPHSDIDVLVVFDPDAERAMFTRIHSEDELADLFGRPVDLTEKRLLENPFSRLEILQTRRIIYPFNRANFTALIEANERMTDVVRNNAALLSMIDSLQALQDFTTGKTFNNYLDDRFFRSAVERELEIVGKAANRLTLSFQSEHAEIDWRGIVGLRNVIAHQYDELDYENIWAIATQKVPQLLEQVQPLLAPFPEDPDKNDS